MPTDEEIINQQNRIQEEIIKSQPLVSSQFPILFLKKEHNIISNTIISDAMKYRKIRGDGNCFYRSFVFGLIERIFKYAAKEDIPIRKTVKLINERIINLLKGAEMQSMIYEDFLDDWKTTIDRLLLPVFPLDVGDRLEEIWRNDEMISHSTIMLFRLVTSAFLFLNWNEYLPFLEGFFDTSHSIGSRKIFCSKWAECMGVESDQIHATCLSNAIGIPIRIFSIEKEKIIPSTISPVDECFKKDDSYLSLLYRPGHYDLLCQ